MNHIYKISLFLSFIVIFSGCNKYTKEASHSNKGVDKVETTIEEASRFEIVSAERSNIRFNNILKESEYMNGLFYEYFYNGSGVAVGDFNNDGWQDIYFVSTISKNKLYLNNKNLNFIDVTIQAKADSGLGFDSGVTTVDINQDGLLDIYICRTGRFEKEDPRRNVLLVNKGIKNGIPQFEDMADTYGLDSPAFSTQAGFLTMIMMAI